MGIVGAMTIHSSDARFYISAGFAGFQWAMIMLIVIAANTISSEFEYGTIKHLIVQGNGRTLVFLAKFLVIGAYDIYLHGLVFGLTLILKPLIYGRRFAFNQNYLYGQSLMTNLVTETLVDLLGSLIIIGMIVMLACVSKTSAVAIATGIVVCFVGQGVSELLLKAAGSLSVILKWNPFNMLFLSNEWSNPSYDHNTLLSLPSLIWGNVIYALVFLVLGYEMFKHKPI
ncbi:hypothetical protein FC98_GL000317 [Lentilactobacillus kisonensis DSM 19906 = JCM 15041]|uniref:ABC superfamily ATP binding cassette transporter, membrane protein n=4 Tax=Lentilactobacillus kisonensis TaxID=481722 RepID=A0A0R1P024_9LACO|nr:hypothetical protein FC98_GL000317 [Lentilactobacillus kisonensis DSM 19906 = JCM 15041]